MKEFFRNYDQHFDDILKNENSNVFTSKLEEIYKNFDKKYGIKKASQNKIIITGFTKLNLNSSINEEKINNSPNKI